MNRPDNTGEPSMEEILASIRQIIADEPGTDRASLDAPPQNPLVPRTHLAGRNGTAASDRRSPLLDRLNGSVPPTSPFGSKRTPNFDVDLADILDEPGPPASAAPKEEVRAKPELPLPPADPAPSAAADKASAANGTAGDLPPQLSATSPLVPPPFGSPDAPSSAPPRNTGFPPLRKPGFYPPQGVTTPVASKPRSGPSAEQKMKSLSGFGSVIPSEVGMSTSTEAGEPQPKLNGASAHVVEPAYSPAPSPPVQAAGPAASPTDDLAAAIAGLSKAAEPIAPHSEPARPAPAPTFSSAPVMEAKQVEKETATVAAQALDALAQGLAASAAHASVPTAPQHFDRHVPVANGTLEPARQQVRTLEDAVAEMLRPMLQQWVSDNMPRIIEKALRVEMAKSLKPGSKPPGR